MVYKCCAPRCNGNYDKTGPKVSVFRFPSDPALKEKWLQALKREKGFTPTSNTRVCELHFKPEEIIREEVVNDPVKKTSYINKLTNPKLKDGVIPSILPNCPEYLSKPEKSRPSVYEHVSRLEEEQFQAVLQESVKTHEQYKKNTSFLNFQEFQECVKKNENLINERSRWNILFSESDILFAIIDRNFVPKISYSVVVNSNCELRVFDEVSEVKELPSLKFPVMLSDLIKLDEILTQVLTLYEVCKPDNESKTEAVQLEYYVKQIEVFMKQMCDIVSDDQRKSVKFLIEQCFSRLFLIK